MYDDPARIRADAKSKATAQATPEGTDRHRHNLPGSWQALAAEAGAREMQLDGLHEQLAEVVRRKVAGDTFAEIGEALDITKTCAKRRFQRARRKLAG